MPIWKLSTSTSFTESRRQSIIHLLLRLYRSHFLYYKKSKIQISTGIELNWCENYHLIVTYDIHVANNIRLPIVNWQSE